MSGSGSSVFMPCDSEQSNELLLRRTENIQGFVAKGVNKIERLV